MMGTGNDWQWIFNKTVYENASHNPKQSNVDKILTTIYVSNFPEMTQTIDLWKECEAYGNIS